MVVINHHTNALTVIKLVIQKADAMNLWDIRNGGIIAVIPGKRIPRTAAIVETKTEDDRVEKSSALATAAGNSGKVLNISTPISNSAWIIDFGATDHMTFDSRKVSPLKSSSQNSVSTANGTSIPIIGEGSLSLTNTLNLDSVLVVPSLNYNLLSFSQITTALFWLEFCVFKNIRTRQTIGCGVR